jgi:4,5-dihydroxyphthalate decarboxylase
MSALRLTTAIATYGHTQPLKDGSLQSERVVLEHVDVSPITSAFRRMVRKLEFDVAEMALSTYLCARAYQKPITALPVFLLRRFEHGAIVYNVKAGMQLPTDLHERKVGVRSYTLTPGVWVRGILQSAYGVDLKRVQWVIFGDEHVQEYVMPPHVVSAPAGNDLVSALLAGEVDAAIGVRNIDSPDIQPLIPDTQNAAIAYYRQTGIYPISHLVVVKDELLAANPWLAEELFALFKAAKDHYLGQLDGSGPLAPSDASMQEMRRIIGHDPLRYGMAPNVKSLEAFIRFNVEQQVIPHQVEVEELFPSRVHALA